MATLQKLFRRKPVPECPRRPAAIPARVNWSYRGPRAGVPRLPATKILRHSPVPVVVPRGHANEIAKGMSSSA